MNDQAEAPKKDFNDLEPEQKGKVLFQKAALFHKEGKLDEALKCYGQAVAFFPDQPDAFNNMAVALRKLSKFEAALACYKRSISLRSDHAGTYSNMGNVLNDLDKIDEAIDAHSKAVKLDPDNLLYLYNKALVLRDAGQSSASIACFNEVLEKDPNYKDCHWDRAITYLMAGDFKNGFKDYDARWELAKSPPRKFPQTRWQGEALGERTLFIHREQGFGDALQFVRLIPEIKKRFGGRILLESQPDLITLFQDIDGVDQHITFGLQPPEFDVWIPLMSLAHILDIDENTIPGDVPYINAPEKTRFRVRAAPKGGLNIALTWGGSPTHQNDRRRSASLDHFLPLAGYKDVTIFSLQKGERADDIDAVGARSLFVDAGSQIKDFADTAGLINQLDLVITVDTSVAHLAGALGKPVWLLLPFTPDWRWMLNRDDSPWYPTLRIFRQNAPGNWENVFTELYKALEEKLAG